MNSLFVRNTFVTEERAPLDEPASAPFTAADLLRKLGDVSADRVLLHGTSDPATEVDATQAAEARQRAVEVIDGWLVEKAVGDFEDSVAAELLIIVGSYVRRLGLGIMNGAQSLKRVVSGSARSPDVAFTSHGRLTYRAMRAAAATPVAPDLSVEVLSKTNVQGEMLKKRRELFASGTRLIWEFEPADCTVAVYTSPEMPDAILDRAATLTGGNVLPGFTLDLGAFWAQFDD